MSHGKGPFTAIAAVLSLVLPGAVARPLRAEAAELPGVVLLPVKPTGEVPERSAARLTTALLEELRTRDADLRVVVPRPPGRAPKGQEAGESLALGKRKLRSLQFAPAAAAFARAIELMLADPVSANFEEVREAYISLAVARSRMREADAARAALTEVARLDPAYRLPSGRYPPAFVALFVQARAAAAALQKGTLAVDGEPDWTVFVDGRRVGRTPSSVPGLPYGKHYVRVEGPGGERLGQMVELAGPTAQVYLVPGGAPAVTPVVEPALLEKLGSLCRANGADFALLAVVSPASGSNLSVGTALYSVRARGVVAFPPFRVDEGLSNANVEAFKLADLLVAAMARFGSPASLPLDLTRKPPPRNVGQTSSTEVARETGPRLTPSPDRVGTASGPLAGGTTAPGPAKEPAVRSNVPWWVWVAGGVGVAAAAGGTWYGISQANRRVTGTVTATW